MRSARGAGGAGAGLAVATLGAAAAWAARGFVVSFPTDAVGPRAIPLLAAGLMLAGGAATALRPSAPEPSRGPRVAGVLTVTLGYATLLPFAGFWLTTTLAAALLARLFEARWRHGFAAGIALATSLWAIFAALLGVALPVGSLWIVGGP